MKLKNINEKKEVIKKNPATKEARYFVGSGSLRSILGQHGNISDEAINKIVNACIFVLKA